MLVARGRRGAIDPSFVVIHRMRRADAPEAYALFNDKEDDYIKVVLTP